ncbi:hypothetical protein HK096_005488 [Nowakowskiella sp. JEL0078]|nr:hypothetical protein HK096_005488 [Nowakowskiella sp. JEL0078]
MASDLNRKHTGSSNESAKERIIYLSRTESFSSAHRLHSPLLSDSDNLALFGKCNSPNGHGHNYKVEIILKGKINKITGMLINITDLKDIMTIAILNPLDHKNLDKDVKYFSEKPSTAENIAVFIWDRIVEQLKDRQLDSMATLEEVRLHETEKNMVFYRGE